MADPLYINGRYTTTDEKVIGVEDRGFQFGDAIYEALKYLGKSPLFVEEHFRRLKNGLEALAIPQPWQGLGEFSTVCHELLDRTSAEDGLIYVQVTRGECERSHFYPQDLRPTVVAYTREHSFPKKEAKRSGIHVVTAPDVRWEHCDVKSVNLLGNVLAKQVAMKAGVAETILIRSGVVTEGCSVSFFGVLDGVIRTHPASPGILPGTVRDRIVSLAEKHGIELWEKAIEAKLIGRLEEAFVTSTTRSVMPVVEIDGARVGGGERGPMTERLQALFDELEAREAREYERKESVQGSVK